MATEVATRTAVPSLPKQEEIEFQLKSDTEGFFFSTSFKEILQIYDKTKNVCKISWFKEEEEKDSDFSYRGHYRFRPKTKKKIWCSLSEKKIGELCPEYIMAPSNQVFWVNQTITVPPKALDDFQKIHHREMNDDEEMCSCILQVLTDQQFRKLFDN